jgi:16S rRNA (cytidine1402-2'-O)-methyltransferase
METRPLKNFYLIGTPIGNLNDITLRAIEILKELDFLITENANRAKKILSFLKVRKPMLVLNEANFYKKEKFLYEIFSKFEKIGYIVSAGMPGVSDPGSRLVHFVMNKFPEFKIKVIPGPSALTAAISLAPFPLNRFLFLGFLPKKKKRRYYLEKIKKEKLPVILFENPKRIEKLLKELKDISKKEVWIFRELTKYYEEVLMIDLENLKEIPKIKGEVVVIIPGSLDSDNVQ